MAEYIDREWLLQNTRTGMDTIQMMQTMIDAPVVEIIRCQECGYWQDACVLLNDGRMRQYTEADVDALGIKNMVSISVGINQGAKCLYEEQRGWSHDHTTFRSADDFCSRAQKRPCGYEEWYGIVDGVYAKQWKDGVGNDKDI